MNKQQIESILNGAPKGATSFDGYTYWKETYRDLHEWVPIKFGSKEYHWKKEKHPDVETMRLVNLQEIIELRERVEVLENGLAVMAYSENIESVRRQIKQLIGDENE